MELPSAHLRSSLCTPGSKAMQATRPLREGDNASPLSRMVQE
jgi:hypothetical protein